MIKYNIIHPKEGNLSEIIHYVTDKDKYLYPPISQIVDINKYSEKLYNNSTIFTAVDDKVIVGMCAGYLNIDNNLSYISYLCVDEKYQHKSIGSKLLNHALDFFRIKMSPGVWISFNSNNKKLFDFYHNHGFDFLNEEYFENTDIKKTNLVIYF